MKKLKTILQKHSGRDGQGRVAVRHQGGRHKRFLREIDFARSKHNVRGRVEAIEYDPNRTADVALVIYADGDRRYILAPSGISVGREILAAEDAPAVVGNALPLSKIPVGIQIHNIEVRPGKGGQIVRGAGSAAIIQGREEGMITVKLPSGEVKKFDGRCFATVGQVGRTEHKSEKGGTAGRTRRMGKRPTVRGVAMHPGAHPHGGGEGRSGVGMKGPKTPWGKPARGVKTRKKRKYSDKYIVTRRKRKR
ncbi:50S ribosomal protein L2 [Candidatus Microgenomates bacterium]|nr:50S ribosomal protein L2 [Candidatus Microgenomates bacterium]